MKPVPDNDLTRRVIGCAMAVHRELGPCLIESYYETGLCDELTEAGLSFARQRRFPIVYKKRTLDGHYQPDIIVEDTLILEIKSVYQILPVHEAQLLTYLRVSGLPLGLLLNFKTALMKDGVTRLINPAAAIPPAPAAPARHIVATSMPQRL